MAEKIINGFSVLAYATQPEGRVPPRAFIETRRLPKKKSQAERDAQAAAQADAPPDDAVQQEAEPDTQAFEIFISRRFRSTVEAMSAARNALDRVKQVDEDGVPDHLPE
ncbi:MULTISPECIES: hypothetical protein [Achromobacter]|uniref:hypothetical protein n=1 Tax=Achromobacter TaxID=222 RepID=UPI001466FE94|nr:MULTISPECIES: hypothetical protein [Achromobacter]MBD9383953.1 hypothetical protein [Achromobacter sp. ACM02]CAB3702632.1 hypothetical protein LMG26852_05254 [Achromobacter aegrifaciens]CAB3855545.1 hypothetical protein LMG3410_02003 [Achromobacter aegrifaciens]